jgi:murein DD-endopeptidase MepM/ murein hydrolase activator NlpD
MRRFRLLALAALSLAVLAACDTTEPPRPTVSQAPANSIFVSRGETLYDVAKRYNVSTRDLIEANGLKPPYVLRPGQRLVLPVPRQYVVKAGDTLYGVSRQYNLDIKEIVRLNNIAPPYMIRVGQTLRLPSASGRPAGPPATQLAAVAGPPAARASAPERKPAAAPTAGTQRRTAAIETVPLDPPPAAPGGAPPPAPQAAAPASPPPPAARPAGSPLAPPPLLPPAPGEPAKVAAAPPPSASLPPGSGMIWPVTGAVLSEYGNKAGGLHNDGINIAAAKGTPVRAAADGVVAYVGNELKGFGNLVLIRHADGVMTAYGHLDRWEVERGAQVRRGQTIGAVGSTGNVSAPQLHFEVRKGSRAIDPREQLAGSPTGRG